MKRRDFIQTCALGATALASGGISGCGSAPPRRSPGAAADAISLNGDWLFGGKFVDGADRAGFDDAGFSRVTLPHSVAKLSWQNWDPATWDGVWIYRRHFRLAEEFRSRRVFVNFERVMAAAAPMINGHALPEHLGGYLPFGYELTKWLVAGDNLLAVAVDCRWKNVPPEGSPKGRNSVDFLEPGGIPGSVTLRAMPQAFVADVFAKPLRVLDADRTVEIICSIDASVVPPKPMEVKVELREAGNRVASAAQTVKIENIGETNVNLTLSNLGNVKLWDVDAPHLYEIITTLMRDREPLHEHRMRIGLRDARFELDGFFLNGRRLQIFGLNRHELFPYAGFAMPRRVMRRDADLLRREFNCNMVRCSHYPQSEAFFDACDELGLLAWEELPGWSYIGDEAWQELAVRDIKEMVRRDRNHPSIVMWGVRVNESANNPAFYERTTAAAKSLDDSRPASGAIVGGRYSTKDWAEDVFAYNDYHKAPDASVDLKPPLPGVPYLVTEAVGQIIGVGPASAHKYRRAGEVALQQRQALFHAQAHDQARKHRHCAGVVAWCALDYGSLINSNNNVKCPGIADVFRIPKLGASFYQAQISPKVHPVIKPNFYWDFGAQTPRGPGNHAAIFSNCQRLEIFVDGKLLTVAQADRANFPHLDYPPFFCDLDLDGLSKPELRIDAYVGESLALSRSFSSDPASDQFLLQSDDVQLMADGADATRLEFKVADKFGEPRLYAQGEVSFTLEGPAVIVGDNPFSLTDSGGVGAIWIKSLPGKPGKITVTASHPLGTKKVEMEAKS